MTFREVGVFVENDWIARLNKKELSPKTVEDYRIILNVLNRTFGKKLLCQFTSEEIEFYRMAVVSDLSIISANRRLQVIKSVFRQGLNIGAIFEDPSKEVKLLSEKEHERTRFLLPHDIVSLVEASKQTKAKFYMPALIYLGAEHSASKQEALSLEWSDIDFEYGGMGLITFFRTKNKVVRTDYLMPRTKQALLDWQNHQTWMRHRKKITPNGSNIVFSHLDGSPLRRFDKAWRTVCRISGIEDFHFHDLRHTFGSNALLAGANQKDVQNLMGHRHLASTDRYLHLPDQHKLTRQKQLARHYLENRGEDRVASGEHIGNTRAERLQMDKKRAD